MTYYYKPGHVFRDPPLDPPERLDPFEPYTLEELEELFEAEHDFFLASLDEEFEGCTDGPSLFEKTMRYWEFLGENNSLAAYRPITL